MSLGCVAEVSIDDSENIFFGLGQVVFVCVSGMCI